MRLGCQHPGDALPFIQPAVSGLEPEHLASDGEYFVGLGVDHLSVSEHAQQSLVAVEIPLQRLLELWVTAALLDLLG